MGVPDFALDAPGKKVMLLGNEAIARGCLEAGVVLGAGYPGTPSTEMLETLAEISEHFPQIKTEWSINEKVGFEVAFGGSMCNARSIAGMKHVGLNVAADAFMTACYAGARGGFVVLSADDPECFSSQNEQDNRYYGIHALTPVFEPTSPDEAKEMVKYAFEFSEKFEAIVVFRTTTRLNHARGDVTLGKITTLDREYAFDWNRARWTFLPTNARIYRLKLLERLEKITQFADQFPFTALTLSDKSRFGILTSGVPYAHTMDALQLLGGSAEVSILKLGMVYPPPKKLIRQLLEHCDKVLVIEELEPFLENILKQEAYEAGCCEKLEIHGKDMFPRYFEFPAELYVNKIAEFLGKQSPIPATKQGLLQSPARPPVLCPGCSHRTTYYAMKILEKELNTHFVHSSDIGCYTLGFYKPVDGVDTCICMGASIGLANGITKLHRNSPVLAILGDSTFFHAGIPALINAVYNQNELLLVIMDNSSTCMTGFQDHPGTGIKITKEPGQKVEMDKLCLGCGVMPQNLWIADSNNLPDLVTKLREAVKAKGVRVFISRHLCALQEMGERKKAGIKPPVLEINKDKCKECFICLRHFGCPALTLKEGRVEIDKTLCSGCKVCLDICPYGAIECQEGKK